MSDYFNIKRDIAIERAGGFWCEACLVSHPLSKQSADPRYCSSCFKFLMDEAKLLPPSRGKPTWVPVPGHPEALPAVEKVVAKLPDKGTPPVGVMQRAGGRPKKSGEVSRVTLWRRKKQQQGVLL